MTELDAEAVAGELTSRVVPAAPRPWLVRLGAAVRIGIRAGLLPAAAVFAIYFARNHALPLPWVRIGSLLAIYGPVIGVSLAVLIEVLVAGADRIARIAWPLAAIANPIVAGTLAGALAGIVPGAVGVTVFGSYTGPYAGTVPIAGGLIAGTMLVAVPLARRARRARWPVRPGEARRGDDRVIAAAAAIATLILSAAAAVVAPIIVHSAFAQTLQGSLSVTGPTVGAIAGAVAGGLVGTFAGLVITLGRSLRPPLRPAR